MAERLPLVPPFRWRLVEVPLHLDYDYWIDDADFDLDFHVRELALPPGATELKLAEQVARIFSRPLDRSRPLWEIYLVHGLPKGRVAVMTKIHHAVIDGISNPAMKSRAHCSTSAPKGGSLRLRSAIQVTRHPASSRC